MNKFKGILFDLDGTLAKTMDDHFRAWKFVLNEYGIKLRAEDYYPLEGMRLQELAKKLFEIHNFNPTDFDEIVQKKEQHYLLNHSNLELYPGVENFINFLKEKNVLTAVVTAGLHERVYSSIPTDFLEKFNVIITGDQTAKGKPSPDPYLKGAEQLGLKPEECIVVENAPLGIKSAKAAGMYCIAVCTTVSREHLTEADEVVNNFDELKELEIIKKLTAKKSK